VLGNLGIVDGPIVLPIVEQDYSVFPPELPNFASYEVKWFFEDSEAGRAAARCPADLTASERAEIELLATQAFLALDSRDVARVDLRMDEEGASQLLEINTLPGCITIPWSSRIPGCGARRGVGPRPDDRRAAGSHDQPNRRCPRGPGCDRPP
jgi:D-alanine-D-alanine ligase-like ATP-grasp enzyme